MLNLDDAEICNICSQLPLSGDYEGEGINGSIPVSYTHLKEAFPSYADLRDHKTHHVEAVIVEFNLEEEFT